MKEFNIKKLRPSEILLIKVKCSIKDTDENSFNIVERPQSYIDKTLFTQESTVKINVETREVSFKNSIDSNEFIYPEGTTHIIWDEFRKHGDRLGPIVPVKVIGPNLYSYAGIWTKFSTDGKKTLYSDGIKSIDELVSLMDNPTIRTIHPFDEFYRRYRHNIYFNHACNEVTALEKMILEIFYLNRWNLLDLFAEKLSYEEMMNRMSDSFVWANLIVSNSKFTKNLQLSYEEQNEKAL